MAVSLNHYPVTRHETGEHCAFAVGLTTQADDAESGAIILIEDEDAVDTGALTDGRAGNYDRLALVERHAHADELTGVDVERGWHRQFDGVCAGDRVGGRDGGEDLGLEVAL